MPTDKRMVEKLNYIHPVRYYVAIKKDMLNYTEVTGQIAEIQKKKPNSNNVQDRELDR